MRICYIAPAESSHMQKWTECMARYGHDVHVISLHEGNLPHATVHCLSSNVGRDASELRKLQYLMSASRVKDLIKQLDPDVVHAHYSSSYGLLAALTCKQPYYLSVWGSDVYAFPRKTIVHRFATKFVLWRATWLMSTSKAMAVEASKYTNKPFLITPFGVDMDLFSPNRRTRTEDDGRFVVGTVKALEPQYGIDVLLRSVASALSIFPSLPIEVRIAGKGKQLEELQSLSELLGISDRVTWLGFISQEQAAIEWANMDVAVIMSESESFGVSSIEAQSCGVPVLYSDIPGLVEAADNGKSGICIEKGNYRQAAYALVDLYLDRNKRRTVGASGREAVRKNYEISCCFRHIEMVYKNNLCRVLDD